MTINYNRLGEEREKNTVNLQPYAFSEGVIPKTGLQPDFCVL